MERKEVRKAMEVVHRNMEILSKELKDRGFNLVGKVSGGVTYSDTNLRFKVELAKVEEDGNALTREAQSYLTHCALEGMKEESLFQVGTSPNGDKMKLLGANTRSYKYPILAENLTQGKAIKMGWGFAKRIWG